MKQQFILALKGATIGIAETIPGVSGGTLAFITGIYERTLNSIKAFSPALIGVARKEGLAGVWKRIDGNFLMALMVGMVVGIGIGLVGVSYFLEHFPPVVWAFFFGLIIASVVYVCGLVKSWNASNIVLFIVGTAVAYGVTRLPVAAGSESLPFIFLCGAIAVSALMLPGISGSFMLLIMGMYQYILHDTFKDGLIGEQDPQALLIMSVFGAGMVVGLATFSRVLSWAFKHYHDATLAVLAGFMLGAMNKLWPWRIPKIIMTEEGSVIDFVKGMEFDKVIKEVNVSPALYTEGIGEPAYMMAAFASLIIGFGGVYLLEKSSKVKI